jgi:hypothetical protein
VKHKDILQLNKMQLFWHYSIVLFLFIVPVITTISVYKYYVTHTYRGVRSIEEIATGYIPIIPAIAFYFIQKRRLRFKSIKISVDAETFLKAAEQTAKELEWEIQTKRKDIIVAKTGFSWRSWGELITIIREEERILINSICDPDNRPSITSLGMNKLNLKIFEQALRKITSEVITST